MMKEKHPVRFIFFSTQKSPRYKEILGFANQLFLAAEISIHSRVEGFSKAILEPGFDHQIILILAASSLDLARILPLRTVFESRPVIVILPGSEKDTMTQALSLYPRYIDYIQNDPGDIYLVLEKMVKKIREQSAMEKMKAQ